MSRTVFFVYGQPVAKGRPRVTSVNGFTKTYTPEKTVNYENLVKHEYTAQVGKFYPNEGLKMEIIAYYKVPSSFSRIKKEKAVRGEIRPLTKPDLDNVAKCICDALNGIAYADDKQIVELNITKYYDEQPRVAVSIKEVNYI